MLCAVMICFPASLFAAAWKMELPVWSQVSCGDAEMAWPDNYPTSGWTYADRDLTEYTRFGLRNLSATALSVTCRLYRGNGLFMGETGITVTAQGYAALDSTEIIRALFHHHGLGECVWEDPNSVPSLRCTSLLLGPLLYTTSKVHEIYFNGWPMPGPTTSPLQWPYWTVQGDPNPIWGWNSVDLTTEFFLSNPTTNSVQPHLELYDSNNVRVVDRDLGKIEPGQTAYFPVQVYYQGSGTYGRAVISWSPSNAQLHACGRLFCSSDSDRNPLKRYAAVIPGANLQSSFLVPYWESWMVAGTTNRATRTFLSIANTSSYQYAWIEIQWTNLAAGTGGTCTLPSPGIGPGETRVLDLGELFAPGTNGNGYATVRSTVFHGSDPLPVNVWCYLVQEDRNRYQGLIDRAACWEPLNGNESTPYELGYWQQKADSAGSAERRVQFILTNPGSSTARVSIVLSESSSCAWTGTVSVDPGRIAFVNSDTFVPCTDTNVHEGWGRITWTGPTNLDIWPILIQIHKDSPYRQAAWATIPEAVTVTTFSISTSECEAVAVDVPQDSSPPFADLSWESTGGGGAVPECFDVQLAWHAKDSGSWSDWCDLRRRTRAQRMKVLVRDGCYRFRVRGHSAFGRVSDWSDAVTTTVRWAALDISCAESSPDGICRKVRVSNGHTEQVLIHIRPQATNTFYDIGFAQGYVTAAEVSNMLDNCIFPYYARIGWTGSLYDSRSAVFTNLIMLPQAQEDELRGIFDGMTNRFAGAPMSAFWGRPMDWRDMLMACYWVDAFGAGCRTFVNWTGGGDLTGRLVTASFYDFVGYWLSNSWVVAYDFPESWTDRMDFVMIAHPGFVTAISCAMNSTGLWEGLVSAWPRRGNDWETRTNRMFWADGSLYRRVMEEEGTIAGAFDHILVETNGGIMFCSDTLHLVEPDILSTDCCAVQERLYSLFPGESPGAGEPTNRTLLRRPGWDDHLQSLAADYNVHYLPELMQMTFIPEEGSHAEMYRYLAGRPDEADGVRRMSAAEMYEDMRTISYRVWDSPVRSTWGPNGAALHWTLWIPHMENGTNESLAYIGLPTDPDDPARDDPTLPDEIFAWRWKDFFELGKDTDGDGLVDAWEMQRFGTLYWNGTDDPDGDGNNNLVEQQDGSDPTLNAANDDLDGDGLGNYAESVAGTDMSNAQSVFTVAITAGPPVETIWSGRQSRSYTIYRTTNLVAPDWQPDGPSTSGWDGIMHRAVDTNPPLSFFRVNVRME